MSAAGSETNAKHRLVDQDCGLEYARPPRLKLRLHVGKEAHLHRETMGNIEKSLDPSRFARVHRSWIVNMDRVKLLEPMFRGDYTVVLRDGRRVLMSKAYRDRLPINR